MTKTCYFCKAPATGIKKEVTLVEQELLNGDFVDDLEEIEEIPVCGSCAVEMYDGTEAYPEVFPL